MMKSKYFPQNNAFLLKNGQLHSFFNSKTKGTNMMIYNIYIYTRRESVKFVNYRADLSFVGSGYYCVMDKEKYQ